MATLVIFLYGVVLFAVQTTLVPKFPVSGVVPDLALIATVYCAFTLSFSRGLFAGFLLGFAQDCLSGVMLGVNTISKSLIAHIFCQLKGKIIVEGPIPVFVFMFLASLCDGVVFYISSLMLLQNPLSPEKFFGGLPVYALYNAVLGPVLVMVFDRNFKWWAGRLKVS